MAELSVHFDFRFGSRSLRLLMIAAMVCSAVTEVASESVTLTTYYPAPSGVYLQMIVTGNTYLARDTAVGAGCPGAANCTKVGIGTPAPTQLLDIENGNVLVGPVNGGSTGNQYFGGVTNNGVNGMRLFSDEPAGGAFIDVRTSPTAFGITSNGLIIRADEAQGGTERMRVTANGKVGIGTPAPTEALDVVGNETLTGFFTPNLAVAGAAPGNNPYLYLNGAAASCGLMTADNGTCAAGYVTWVPGIYIENGPIANGYAWATGPNIVIKAPLEVGQYNEILTVTPPYYCCDK
ncbi:MAG: hypothetical protein ACHQ49_01865 [Elusimicrobiota bacterium]